MRGLFEITQEILLRARTFVNSKLASSLFSVDCGWATISECSPFLEIALGGRPGLTTSLREAASVPSKGHTMNDELVLAAGAGCKSRALH